MFPFRKKLIRTTGWSVMSSLALLLIAHVLFRLPWNAIAGYWLGVLASSTITILTLPAGELVTSDRVPPSPHATEKTRTSSSRSSFSDNAEVRLTTGLRPPRLTTNTWNRKSKRLIEEQRREL